VTDNKIAKIPENKEVHTIQEQNSSSRRDLWQRKHNEQLDKKVELVKNARKNVDKEIGGLMKKYVVENKHILVEPVNIIKQAKINKLKEDLKKIIENVFIGYTNMGVKITDNDLTTTINAKIKFLDEILQDENKLENTVNGIISDTTKNLNQP
jgi:hypothetical protein